jgi:hypothetical protein
VRYIEIGGESRDGDCNRGEDGQAYSDRKRHDYSYSHLPGPILFSVTSSYYCNFVLYYVMQDGRTLWHDSVVVGYGAGGRGNN